MTDQEINIVKRVHDKQSGLLQGFEINLGPNEKVLHVNVHDYSPQGKSPEETKQLREDFANMYQSAIEKNPEDAGRYFKKIAHDFPQGISWGEPGQGAGADVGAGTLKMQGAPNLNVIDSQADGRAFIRWHGIVSSFPYQPGHAGVESTDAAHKNLQGAAAAINNGDYFTGEQKERLNALLAANINGLGLQAVETQAVEQSFERVTQLAIG